jgi:peroxiredoxin
MPKVNIDKQAPNFSSLDFLGNQISLKNYFNKKNVLLVFNRGFM